MPLEAVVGSCAGRARPHRAGSSVPDRRARGDTCIQCRPWSMPIQQAWNPRASSPMFTRTAPRGPLPAGRQQKRALRTSFPGARVIGGRPRADRVAAPVGNIGGSSRPVRWQPHCPREAHAEATNGGNAGGCTPQPGSRCQPTRRRSPSPARPRRLPERAFRCGTDRAERGSPLSGRRRAPVQGLLGRNRTDPVAVDCLTPIPDPALPRVQKSAGRAPRGRRGSHPGAARAEPGSCWNCRLAAQYRRVKGSRPPRR